MTARPAPALAPALVLALVAVLLPAALPTAAPAARAAAAEERCDASLGSADAIVDCLRRHGGGGTGSAVSGGGGGAATGPRYRYRYQIACAGNTVDGPVDALCVQATTTCPQAGQIFYLQSRSTDGVVWERDGARCLTPAEAAAGQAFPGFTVTDLRDLPLPPADVVLQPGNGYALAQVPLVVMAAAGVAVLPTQLLGFGVTVRATPVSWTWDFGDGTTLGPTSDPGAPYPALDLTHTYATAGTYAITLTTSYAGEYSVDGGAFAPVDGLAQVVSAPVPVTVLTGRGALVQDPLG